MKINENYDEWVRVYDVVEENNRMWRTIVANKEEEAMEKEKKAVEKEKQKTEKKVQRVENKLHIVEQSVNKKVENNTIQIIKNLLKQKLDINLISEVTGMSVSKIKNLDL